MDEKQDMGGMTDEQIKHMANRFLGWNLPESFSPDGGIKFDPIGNRGSQHEYRHQPVGTNLFTYTEAVEMVRHMVEGLPAPERGLLGYHQPDRIAGLSDYMRRQARNASDVAKMMAREKSLRQPGHNPPRDDLYMAVEPEQTIEWEIADILAAIAHRR